MVTPISMPVPNSPFRQVSKWMALSGSALFGILVSFGMFWIVLNVERKNDEVRFRELANQQFNALKININAALDSLSILTSHFEIVSASINRDGFHRITLPIVGRHPFIQALEWIPRVRQLDRLSYEAAAQQDGLKGFHFSQRDAQGALQPADERDEYYPVYYVEPLAANSKALGFDLASDETRKAALVAARDKDEMVATARITLVQEHGDQYGVLVFSPVHLGQHSLDPSDRQPPLIGYILGVFRIFDFMTVGVENYATGKLDGEIDLHLFDLSAAPEGRQLYPRTQDKTYEQLIAGQHFKADFDFAGRAWQVVATPSASFHQAKPPIGAWITLVSSLLSTIFFVSSYKGSLEKMHRLAELARDQALAKKQLHEVHRIAHLGFLEYDPASRLMRVGEGTHAMLGISEAIKAGSPESVLINLSREDRDRILCRLGESRETDFEIEIHVQDHVFLVINDKDAEAGPLSMSFFTFQDITQRYVAEQERANMAAHAMEAGRMEALGTLAGGIAHEINTPIQFIGDNLTFIGKHTIQLLKVAEYALTSIETGDVTSVADKIAELKYEFVSRELPAAVEQAQEGIAKISSIVQAIKEFSFPSGKTPHPFSINRAIEVTATVTRNQWKYTSELSQNLDPELPQFNGIEGEINQVLVNLVINASQAIAEKKDSKLGKIDITTSHTADFIEITVADTGIGIPAENLGRMFDLFFTTKAPGIGTGQGLSITKSIIARHGGTIAVESEFGRGTKFIIRLPLKSPTKANDVK